MDATLSFGVTMISEVPSNPQLTLVSRAAGFFWSIFFLSPFFKLRRKGACFHLAKIDLVTLTGKEEGDEDFG